MKRLALLSLCAAAASVFANDPASPDAQARFIAGMSVDGTPLQSIAAQSQSWQSHAKQFDQAWAELKERQLDKIAAWVPDHLGQGAAPEGPLYYMFSGPDFLYANAFFPDAPVYILCGTEPVGKVPDIAALKGDAISHGLNSVRNSLEAVLNFSFFITKDMKKDLAVSQLDGTLPILYVFLARSGCRVEDVDLVFLDKEGKFTSEKTKNTGVHITFTGRKGKRQQLYYFTTDLSNWGIKENPGFMKFCETQGIGHGFVKAASYLMHLDHFTTVRDFLLTHTRTMVQDDSGIPMRDFPADRWMVLGYGSYSSPIDLFKDKYQPEVARLFKEAPADPLPFSFGYTWHKNQSSILYGIALNYVPKAKPVGDGE